MFHILGTIISLVAAFWVYNDAKHYHSQQAAVAWAIGVFLFLIIVLPLYLFFGRRRGMSFPSRQAAPRRNHGAIDVEGEVVHNTINCPMCGKKIDDTLDNCPACGYSIRRTCPKCGLPVGRELSVCPACHTVLNSK